MARTAASKTASDVADDLFNVPLNRSFTYRFHQLSKLSDPISHQAYLEEAGLSLSDGRCLSTIGSFEPLSVKDLARMANVDKAQASRAAQTLVDKGLVSKTVSATDARGVVLRFTPAGQALWHRLMAVVQARNDEIVACLSAAERAQLAELLARLVEHARAVAGEKS